MNENSLETVTMLLKMLYGFVHFWVWFGGYEFLVIYILETGET